MNIDLSSLIIYLLMSSMCFSNFCILFLLSNPSAAEKISSAPFCAASIFFQAKLAGRYHHTLEKQSSYFLQSLFLFLKF